MGASQEIARAISKNGRVLHGADLQKETSKEDWFREGVERLSQTLSERIRLDEFIRTPYLNVLTYPRPNLAVARVEAEATEEAGRDRDRRSKVGPG